MREKKLKQISRPGKKPLFRASLLSAMIAWMLFCSTPQAWKGPNREDSLKSQPAHILPVRNHAAGFHTISSAPDSLDIVDGRGESRASKTDFLRPLFLGFINISDIKTVSFYPFSSFSYLSSSPYFSLSSLFGFRRMMSSLAEDTEEKADLRFPGKPGSDLLCIAELMDTDTDFDYTGPVEGVTTPILINRWVFGGVEYTDYFQEQRNRHIDCRLALALNRAGGVLKNIGVTQVIWSSAYRPPAPRAREHGYEKHNLGIAIDIHGFVFAGNMRVMVADHYEKGLGFQRDHLCHGRPLTREGFLLRLAACRLDSSDLFAEILTPDYDAGHWNHFHMAVFHPSDRSRRRHKNTALIEVPLNSIPGWAMARSPHSNPELKLWEEAALALWPEDYGWLKEHLQKRWTAWKEKNPDADPETGLSGNWDMQMTGEEDGPLHKVLISAVFKRLTSILN